MLRSKQYKKLYKKYHSLKLNQSDLDWFVATRACNQLKWRRLHEKNM